MLRFVARPGRIILLRYRFWLIFFAQRHAWAPYFDDGEFSHVIAAHFGEADDSSSAAAIIFLGTCSPLHELLDY